MIVESAEQAWEVLESGEAYLITPREIAVQGVILGAVVGGVVGYFAYRAGEKAMSARYEEIIEQEIAEAKAFYSRLNKEGMETPEKAVAALYSDPEEDVEATKRVKEAAAAIEKYQGNASEEGLTVVAEVDEDDEVTIIMQDHPEADEGWDYEEELEIRLELAGEPYIIHLDEFMENEHEHNQECLTYYAGDNTLADERDEAIPHADPIVGEGNLQRFGHGSGDPRVVLIRNERLSMDYEVSLADGKYAHEVMGLEHSDGGARAAQRRKELRKFRGDRE